MTGLVQTDVTRLGKLLGLLASNHLGERAAAALKATEFLAAHHLAWSDIAALLSPPMRSIGSANPELRQHQRDACECLQSNMVWKSHELEFLRQMGGHRKVPSDKQRDWLDGLLDRATSFERRRA